MALSLLVLSLVLMHFLNSLTFDNILLIFLDSIRILGVKFEVAICMHFSRVFILMASSFEDFTMPAVYPMTGTYLWHGVLLFPLRWFAEFCPILWWHLNIAFSSWFPCEYEMPR